MDPERRRSIPWGAPWERKIATLGLAAGSHHGYARPAGGDHVYSRRQRTLLLQPCVQRVFRRLDPIRRVPREARTPCNPLFAETDGKPWTPSELEIGLACGPTCSVAAGPVPSLDNPVEDPAGLP